MKPTSSFHFAVLLFLLRGLGGFLLLTLLLSCTLGWAQKPELRVQIGHTGAVTQIVPLPDGKSFLSASDDGTVKHWDVVNGREIRTIQTSYNWASRIILLPDGKSFLSFNISKSSGEHSVIKHWDIATGEVIQTFSGHYEGIQDVVLLPNAKSFLSASIDNTIKHWDITTGEVIQTFSGHNLDVKKIILLSDNKSFLSTSGDNTIIHWDLSTGKVLQTFTGRNSNYDPFYYSDIVLLSDNKSFLTTEKNGTVNHWDLITGKLIKRFDVSPSTGSKSNGVKVKDITLLEDNKSFLLGSNYQEITHWDLTTGQRLPFYKGGTKFILLANTDTILVIDDKIIKKVYLKNHRKGVEEFIGHNSKVRSLALLSNSRSFLSGDDKGEIKLWDLDRVRVLQTYKGGGTKKINDIALLPNNKMFLCANSDKTIKYWSLVLGNVIHTIIENDEVEHIVLVKDTNNFISAGENYINYREFSNGEIIQTFEFPTTRLESLLFLSNNKNFLSFHSNSNNIFYWDLDLRSPIQSFNFKGLNTGVISPDAKSFIYTQIGSKVIKYINLTSKKTIPISTNHKGNIEKLVVLPDGKSILSGSTDGTVKHWDLDSGKEIQTFTAIEGGTIWHDTRVEDITLLANSKTFLTIEYGNILKHWDLLSGKEIHNFGDIGIITTPTLLPDNETFLSINSDNTLKHWNLAKGRLLGTFYSRFGGIKSVHLLENQKQFLTINEQNSITLWDLEKKQEIVTLIPLAGDNKDYVLVTPDGRFDGTPEGMKKLLHFVVGNEVVELEQLKDRYYEPGLWKKLMGYSNEPLRNIQDIKDKGLDLYPETILKLNDNKLTIKLLPRSGGVGKVSLFVGNKRIVEDLNPQRKTEFVVDLKQYNKFFSKGQADTLGIVAYEQEGTLPSRPEIVEYEADLDIAEMEKNKKRQPHFYGVFIGTSNYQDGSGLPDLVYPTKDAQDLSKAMQLAAQNLLIEPQNVHVTLLSTDDKNNLPSKANIRKVLEGLAQNKEIRKEDVLVVYFSGHGVSYTIDNKDQFFYITQDLSSKNLDDKVVREAFTISTEEIAQWMVNVVARKQVLILDACASGKAVEQAQELLAKREVPTSQKRALELLKDRTGIFVISGSTSDASSYEASPYGQGFLTYALLSGIVGGALQNGEYVDVMSLFQYAANRVPEIAQEFGVIQQPQIATPSKVNSFPIGKVGEKEKKAIQIAQPKPFFVRSSFFNPEENEDNLNLADLLNQSIRENMGAGRSASAIFFDVNNHPQGYKIIGSYTLKGEAIQVKWQIKNQKTGEKSQEFGSVGEKTKLEELSKKIFESALVQLNK